MAGKSKFHVTPKGQARECSAKTPEACRYSREAGETVPHFDKKEDAQAYAEKKLAAQHGNSASVKKIASTAKTDTKYYRGDMIKADKFNKDIPLSDYKRELRNLETSINETKENIMVAMKLAAKPVLSAEEELLETIDKNGRETKVDKNEQDLNILNKKFADLLEQRVALTKNMKRKKDLDSANTMPSDTKDSSKVYDPDLAVYKHLIKDPDTLAVYKHPQGKVAIVKRNGDIEVYKNGVKAPSSLNKDESTTDKNFSRLTNGEKIGRWEYVSDASRSVDSSTESADEQAEKRRQSLNVSRGYPADSHFNARKGSSIKTVKKNYNEPAPILPTSTKVNPHKGLKGSEYLDAWGEDTNIEVWQDRNSGRSILVATASESVFELGTKSNFIHDQTYSRLGAYGSPQNGGWNLIGAFENKEGGAIIGEVPNKTMSIYTYK